jgi:hypothetical protein
LFGVERGQLAAQQADIQARLAAQAEQRRQFEQTLPLERQRIAISARQVAVAAKQARIEERKFLEDVRNRVFMKNLGVAQVYAASPKQANEIATYLADPSKGISDEANAVMQRGLSQQMDPLRKTLFTSSLHVVDGYTTSIKEVLSDSKLMSNPDRAAAVITGHNANLARSVGYIAATNGMSPLEATTLYAPRSKVVVRKGSKFVTMDKLSPEEPEYAQEAQAFLANVENAMQQYTEGTAEIPKLTGLEAFEVPQAPPVSSPPPTTAPTRAGRASNLRTSDLFYRAARRVLPSAEPPIAARR